MNNSRRPEPSTRERQNESRAEHADAETDRVETPELEGRMPLPEEITGRASGTDDDLVTMFDDEDGDHITDGFRGGSEDDPAEG
jgi:hypothetical protein